MSRQHIIRGTSLSRSVSIRIRQPVFCFTSNITTFTQTTYTEHITQNEVITQSNATSFTLLRSQYRKPLPLSTAFSPPQVDDEPSACLVIQLNLDIPLQQSHVCFGVWRSTSPQCRTTTPLHFQHLIRRGPASTPFFLCLRSYESSGEGTPID